MGFLNSWNRSVDIGTCICAHLATVQAVRPELEWSVGISLDIGNTYNDLHHCGCTNVIEIHDIQVYTIKHTYF